MKKNKKQISKVRSLKGFTLVEVVMAILIFAIGSSLLVTAGVAIVRNTNESRNIVRKINRETAIIAYAPRVNTDNPIDAYNGLIDDCTSLTQLKISSSDFTIPTGYNEINIDAFEATPQYDVDAYGHILHNTRSNYNLKYFHLED